MSILVVGMEMPKSCDECYIRERNTCPLLKTNVDGWGKCISCPLVDIPPHGRLIDADALAEYANNTTVGIDANDIMRFPIVMEAERERNAKKKR